MRSPTVRIQLADGRSVPVRAAAANLVLNQTIQRLLPSGPPVQLPLPNVPQALHVQSSEPICIIGAGSAGLYTAMILDTLNIPYEILEASNRIGGRIYTHRFNGDEGINKPINDPARYDYVDMGAMRFPDIEFMGRVFDLFDRLDMKKGELLIEYQYTAPNTFELYNDKLHNSADPVDFDAFGVSEEKGGAVPNIYVRRGVDNVLKDVFGPWAKKFNELEFQETWKELTGKDSYSTRGFMTSKAEHLKYPEAVVEWLETFAIWDCHCVMDAMDFGSSTATRDAGVRGQGPDYKWWCIDGGSDHLVRRMVDKTKTKPKTGVRVVAIKSTPLKKMEVESRTSDGKTMKRTYSQVICTAPLGCVSAIQIPEENLSYMQRLEIRALNYDTSTKVALKFKSRWWEDPEIMGSDRVIKGDVSSTDIPIRTCVYPSYGFNATSKPPGVLLASYTWAQDAQRLGGLAQGKGTEADQRLVELTLQNLSQLHGIEVERFGELVDHYAHNWHNDVNARGAFALFGPGQFGNRQRSNSMFASIKAPAAGGNLHFAGEATSVHHAWVLGALNSTWRAVYNALGKMGDGEEKRKQLIKEWKIPDEEDPELLISLAVLAEENKL